MITEGNDASMWSVIGITIGGLFTLAGINMRKKRGDASELAKGLKEIKELNRDLRKLLKEERKLRGIIEGKYENIKFAFKVVFNEYEIKFKEHPEQLSMLKDLRDAFTE